MITVTPKAVQHFKKMLQSNQQALGIRLGIERSGCSGNAYLLDYALEKIQGDQVVKVDDLQIFVNEAHLTFLKGTEIDCVEEQAGMGSVLKFKNPNVKGECGCGESFALYT